jgi:hypothetical protein
MLIQTPVPGRRLQLGLNLEGAPPTPSLNPELQPVVIVDDYRELDYQSPGSERPAQQDQYVAAGGAAVFGYIMLQNPTRSGMLLNVRAVRSWLTAAANPDNYMAIWNYATASGLGRFRDTRFVAGSSGPYPAGKVTTGTYTGAAPSWQLIGHLRSVYNAVSILDWTDFGPWIISPGWSLVVIDATANESLYAMFSWTERVLNAQGG